MSFIVIKIYIYITGSSVSTLNTSPSWTWGDRSGSSLDSILYVILSRKDKTGSSQVQLELVFLVDPLDPVIAILIKFIGNLALNNTNKIWLYSKCENIKIKLIYYQIQIENKIGKKLHQLCTRCVTGVTRILITLLDL